MFPERNLIIRSRTPDLAPLPDLSLTSRRDRERQYGTMVPSIPSFAIHDPDTRVCESTQTVSQRQSHLRSARRRAASAVAARARCGSRASVARAVRGGVTVRSFHMWHSPTRSAGSLKTTAVAQ